MKKIVIYSFRTYLFFIVALASIPVSAEEVLFEGIRYDLNKKTKLAKVLENNSLDDEIIIPKFIKHGNTIYVVNCIGDKAFANSNISCISLPATISKIGKYAFANCEKLEAFSCDATTPPTLGKQSLPENKNTKLYVLNEEIYRSSEWGLYFNIIVEKLYEGNVTLQEFDVFDENASFPGGDEACTKWIASNIGYPKYCSDKGIEGRVIVSFVVDRDGSIDNIEVIRSPHELLSAEAIRVVSSMPKWKPARIDTKSVRSRFNLPIMFSLGERKKSNETIIQEYVSININTNYEFHIIEQGESEKFDFNKLKREYEIPEIFTEKTEYNKNAFNYIQEFSKQKSIDSVIPVIIGTRIKGSENEWTPTWYLVLLDANKNVLDIFNYYP